MTIRLINIITTLYKTTNTNCIPNGLILGGENMFVVSCSQMLFFQDAEFPQAIPISVLSKPHTCFINRNLPAAKSQAALKMT